MAEENSWKKDEEEDEEDEIDETQYKQAKDAILFTIDVSSSMLTPPSAPQSKNADSDSALTASLKCAYQLMTQRIISNPNDMMGILLYGTEQTKFLDDEDSSSSSTTFPHCYVLVDLRIPSAEDVKSLRTLIDDHEEFEKLMVPTKEQVLMAHVLFCANHIFTLRAANFASKRLFIVTDNDDPNGKDKDRKNNAEVRGKDLFALGVIIELFPVAKHGDEFDRTKFYSDIVFNPIPTDLEAQAPLLRPTKVASTGEGMTLLTSLLSSINSRAVAKRALFSNVPLELGPGCRISVKGFIIFKAQQPRRTTYVYLKGEKPQIARAISIKSADDSGENVEKTAIRKAYKFGGEQITFSPDEMTKIRNFGEAVIRIVGFKPLTQNMLPIWANLKTSTFISPSEEGYVGSTRVFSTLHQKLLRDNIMGVVWFIARKNAAPVIAALVAGDEKVDEDGDQTLPPGMWLIPLPYADDIRGNPDVVSAQAPEQLIDKMRVIVQQLQLPKGQYLPAKYPNPALQWHYRILQALALEEELPEKAEDKTEPKYKQIHKRAGQYVVDWGNELIDQHRIWEDSHAHEQSTLPKRPRPREANDEPALKKSKLGGMDGISNDDMRGHFNKHTISKLTVADLKGWLTRTGLESSGKKADLVDRVEAYWEKK